MATKVAFAIVSLLALNVCSFAQSTKPCGTPDLYIKKVDASKPFLIEGKYCLEYERDTLVDANVGVVRLHIFNRLTGEIMNEGYVWFGKESKTKFTNGYVEVVVPVEKYEMSVHPVDPHYPFSIGNFKVKPKKIMAFNCYIGNRLEF